MSPEPGVQRFTARVMSTPFLARAWLWGAAALSALAGFLWIKDVVPDGGQWFFCAATFFLGLGFALPLKPRWRQAEITVGDARVQIEGAGGEVRDLRPRQVRALSTAVGPDGLIVALALKGLGASQARPAMIQVDTVQQADALCDALAVGNRGVGVLEWGLGGSSALLRKLASWGLVLGSALMPLRQLMGRHDREGFTVLVAMGLVASLGLLVASAFSSNDLRKVVLHEKGVDLTNTRCGWGLVPYSCIDEVRCTGEGFEMVLSPPHPTIPVKLPPGALNEDELQHLIDQIRAASLRARGLGRRGRDTDSNLDGLHRSGETAAQWLKRLEQQAAALRSGAYRGDSYNENDLWEALDDHDASAEVRLAAARVLSQVEPEKTRVRVARLVEEQRDDEARAAFELLLEEQDLAELAEGLERSAIWRQHGG